MPKMVLNIQPTQGIDASRLKRLAANQLAWRYENKFEFSDYINKSSRLQSFEIADMSLGVGNIQANRSGLPDTERESLRHKIMGMERENGWYGAHSLGVSKGACNSAVQLIEEAISKDPSLPLPRVSPSALGGVALQWDFLSTIFTIRVASGRSGKVYYQKGGRRDFCHQESGVGNKDEVLGRLQDAYRDAQSIKTS